MMAASTSHDTHWVVESAASIQGGGESSTIAHSGEQEITVRNTVTGVRRSIQIKVLDATDLAWMVRARIRQGRAGNAGIGEMQCWLYTGFRSF